MEVSQPESKDLRGVSRVEQHRFTLVKPFSAPQLLSEELLIDNKMIHFIVPVSGAVTERFEVFLKNFEEVCLMLYSLINGLNV